KGIVGWVIAHDEALVIPDVSQDPRFYSQVDERTKFRTQSVICVPMRIKGRVVGALELVNPDRQLLRDEFIVSVVEAYASLAAVAIENARLYDRLQLENQGYRRVLKGGETVIVGDSPAIRAVLEVIERVAPAVTTVLILGESGTGKELVAKRIHELSPRRDAPFIAVHCAALPESLLESELFGHEKGAFTGASSRKLGRFELAHGGTIFLDEIGELSPAIQAKLLRLLQFKEFERVGGTQTLHADVRILAATNRDLRREVEKGHFREDLYYRLNVVPITVPPLRERREDIPLLAEFFVQRFSRRLGIPTLGVSAEALQILSRYHWPGNVRELENVIERAMVLFRPNWIEPEHLPPELRQGEFGSAETDSDLPPLWQVERRMILRALEDTGWNQSAAARQLGISRSRLRYRIKKFRVPVRKGGSRN
ncbi:MAG TPA: GAF domain-containing protein, partial [Bacteroidetes bacterium]|nr:GAF domain-containing protein [Bacteroidota bacterium]